jgi:hypothetical protein
LIDAFTIAKEKGYDGKLFIIGGGSDNNKVVDYISDNKFKEEIKLLGPKSNPYN